MDTSKIFFISDMHFGDENINRYENRGFTGVAQMDDYIINKWNEESGINEDSQVFVLGDVSMHDF